MSLLLSKFNCLAWWAVVFGTMMGIMGQMPSLLFSACNLTAHPARLVDFLFFFTGVPLVEYCRVDDTLPERTVVGLPPGWVDLVPMLADCTSASVSLTQLRGRPWGLLQWHGGRTDTQWWSCLESACVTCLKKWSHLSWIRAQTIALVTCLVYGIWRILRSDHVSKASSRIARVFITVPVTSYRGPLLCSVKGCT